MTTQELNTIFDKFLKDNNGRFVERVDSTSLNQCFDLAIYFCEYLGFPKTIYSGLLNAYQIYSQWSNPSFIRIENDDTFVPIKGDIVVWSGSKPGTGGAGHVAVCTGVGDINVFQAFSQNDPTGSPSILKTYDYSYVLGVQRLKVTDTPPMNDNIIRKASSFDKLVKYYHSIGALQTDDADKVSYELMKEKFDYERNEKIRLTPKAVNWDKACNKYKINSDTSSYEDLQKAIDASQNGENNNWQSQLLIANTTIGQLKTKISTTKQSLVTITNTL